VKRTLLLNGDWQALNFVSDRRAISLLMCGRAEVVYVDDQSSIWEGETMSSPSTTFDIPATIRLVERIDRRWVAPRFRKRVMFTRDNWSCQYCNVRLEPSSTTIDHILPRSRGGATSWKNCVTSCQYCNRIKGNQTPGEAGMSLLCQPTVPSPWHFCDGSQTTWHRHWHHFLRRQGS
jgi:5-methylcytosine-specific restriction endonuclease McrA